METLVVIAVITVLIVPVILIVAGCKLISAAKEFRKGKETQEKMLQALQKIQSELAAFKKDIGSVPVEKKALEKEIVPQSAGKEIYGKQTAAVPKDEKTVSVSASCEPEKKNGAERKNAPSAPVLVVPFRTIKLPALPVCSVNLQIQVASRNLRPYIRVWFTSRTLHRTGGYNDRR